MFTVELDAAGKTVEIYCDEEGFETLQRSINAVLRSQSHDHLMTPSWGGTELTEDPQGEQTELIHQLVLVYRKDE